MLRPTAFGCVGVPGVQGGQYADNSQKTEFVTHWDITREASEVPWKSGMFLEARSGSWNECGYVAMRCYALWHNQFWSLQKDPSDGQVLSALLLLLNPTGNLNLEFQSFLGRDIFD